MRLSTKRVPRSTRSDLGGVPLGWNTRDEPLPYGPERTIYGAIGDSR